MTRKIESWLVVLAVAAIWVFHLHFIAATVDPTISTGESAPANLYGRDSEAEFSSTYHGDSLYEQRCNILYGQSLRLLIHNHSETVTREEDYFRLASPPATLRANASQVIQQVCALSVGNSLSGADEWLAPDDDPKDLFNCDRTPADAVVGCGQYDITKASIYPPGKTANLQTRCAPLVLRV